jgi:hypothetical protein
MRNYKAFDPEAALRAFFGAEREEEERSARPLAASRGAAKKPFRAFAEAGALAAIAACMAAGIAFPSRSPLIEESGRIFAECARNGTFQALGDSVLAMSGKAGEWLSAPRNDLTTEEP